MLGYEKFSIPHVITVKGGRTGWEYESVKAMHSSARSDTSHILMHPLEIFAFLLHKGNGIRVSLLQTERSKSLKV